jgi:rhodanese-related sulfurtransferase
MIWTALFIVAAIFLVFYLIKRSGWISIKEAQAHLKRGALIVDVRTAGEFVAGHLPNALNLPLGEIEELLPRRVSDRNQVLLLHCQSGTRSAAASRKLRRLGYPNAFNAGSYARAAQIAGCK